MGRFREQEGDLKMGRVLIVGIDPSSRKLAIITSMVDGSLIKRHVILLPAQKEQVTCTMVYTRLRNLLKDSQKAGYDPRVFIEREVYVPGKGGIKAVIPQSQVQGAVLAATGSLDIPIERVSNTSWKKDVTGKGSNSKAQIRSWLSQYWRNAYDVAQGDQDLIDAACINRYGAKTFTTKKMTATPRRKK